MAKVADPGRHRDHPDTEVANCCTCDRPCPFRSGVGPNRVDTWNHPRKRPTASGRDELIRARLLGKTCPDTSDDLVAGHLTVALVHEGKAIKIQHHKRQRSSRLARVFDLTEESTMQGPKVRKARRGVTQTLHDRERTWHVLKEQDGAAAPIGAGERAESPRCLNQRAAGTCDTAVVGTQGAA